MATIFISHTQQDLPCAERICRDLEAKGYTTWREPGYPGPTDNSYPQMIENAILGSAAIILVWSNSAAQSEWVERHILFARRLKKALLAVSIDGNSLPNTLVSVSPIASQLPCVDTSAQLLTLLPPAGSNDPLIKLSEQAAHEYVRERKEAIEAAAVLLKRDEHREAVLAILEYLSKHDLIMGVRDKAQEVLDADAKKETPPAFRPDEARYIFGERCKNGHITYFDKRRVCPAQATVVRKGEKHAGVELDRLDLRCATCSVEITALVDCKGYY